MVSQPSAEALARFGARLVAPLGGRLNQHWLVEARGMQLVLRRWWQPANEVAYEVRLLERIAALGWPVAPAVDGPVELGGVHWSMAPLLPGEPRADKNSAAEQRARGRLLAELHHDLAQIQGLGQRGAWRRCEQTLADPSLDTLLAAYERAEPEEARALRWHLERARARVAGVALHERPGTIVHGDFTTWNLHFHGGRLSGILDFELARDDHRVADFALSWRGRYDEVIRGYDEVSPLAPEEWALITPAWWAHLIEGACSYIRSGVRDDGWTMKQLLRRSPLMGPDAVEYRVTR
jgi:Ser/Thr protein kinase RdoA (MazF antagonist)